MNSRNDMVIYDQWSYMTMVGVFEAVFNAFPQRIQIDRMLFEEG
jgi:hypothetical protein